MRRGICGNMNLRARKNLWDMYITPAMEQGYIRMLYPDHPNSPDQAYLLTAKGLELYNALENVFDSGMQWNAFLLASKMRIFVSSRQSTLVPVRVETDIWLSRSLLVSKHMGVYAQAAANRHRRTLATSFWLPNVFFCFLRSAVFFAPRFSITIAPFCVKTKFFERLFAFYLHICKKNRTFALQIVN